MYSGIFQERNDTDNSKENIVTNDPQTPDIVGAGPTHTVDQHDQQVRFILYNILHVFIHTGEHHYNSNHYNANSDITLYCYGS